MKRKILLVAIPLLVLAIAVSVFLYDRAEDRENAVAIVNGKYIDKAEYEAMLEQAKASYQQIGVDFETEEGKQLLTELEKTTLDNMINRELLLQDVANKGYTVSKESINERFEIIKAQFPDDETFNEALAAGKLTLEEFNEIIADDLKIEKYLEKEIPQPVISETEMKTLYEQYKEQMGEGIPTFEELKPQLQMQLQQEKSAQELEKLIEKLRANSQIEILI